MSLIVFSCTHKITMYYTTVLRETNLNVGLSPFSIFMAKWIAAEKTRAGLRHAVVYPYVTGRTKEMIAQSKRARAGSLAIVD